MGTVDLGSTGVPAGRGFGDSRGRITMLVLMALCVMVGALVYSSGPASAFFDYEGVTPTTVGTPCIAEPCMGEELRDPTGIAVNDQTGDVYVSDTGDGRVVRFGPAGAFESEITGTPTGPGGTIAPFSSVGAIAVDNSTNPLDESAGDVYVVDGLENTTVVIDKFDEEGHYLGQIKGIPGEAFIGVFGLAVGPSGQLWALSREARDFALIASFGDQASNLYASQFVLTPTAELAQVFASPPLALTADGSRVYAAIEGHLLSFTTSGLPAGHLTSCGAVTGLAAGPGAGNILGAATESVTECDEAGNVLQTFGLGSVSSGDAVAVNAGSGIAYVANEAGVVDAFTPVLEPDVTTGTASAFTRSTVTLNGVVAPAGGEVTSCLFEYGPEATYGQSAPCSPSTPYATQTPVTAVLPSIERGKLYHYRLVANGHDGLDRTFLDPALVTIDSESALSVSSESTELQAEVDPGGVEATYRFEYGTTASYGADAPIPEGTIEAASTDQTIAAHLQNLQPGTVYHYRVTATNQAGLVSGPDHTFATPSPAGTKEGLPDGRAYELVSPADKDGANIEGPGVGGGGTGVEGGPVRASTDGSRVTYLASAPFGELEGNALGSQIVSSRSPRGWSSLNINIPHDKPTGISIGGGVEYGVFSSDLSLGLVSPSHREAGVTPPDPPLSPLAPAGYHQFYLRETLNGGYQPLLTSTPPASPAQFGMVFEGASRDLHHIVVSMEGNLYEWTAGQFQLINYSPEGALVPHAILGADGGTPGEDDPVGAVSGDGAKVVWAVSEPPFPTFFRDVSNGTTTALDGTFAAASSDDGFVFTVSSGDVFVFEDASGVSRDLTVDHNPTDPSGASVRGLLGASEDGSYVYFVATGALESGAGSLLSNQAGAQPESGADNLYMLHQELGNWTTAFVSTLDTSDESDWTPIKTERSSQVSGNGQFVAFTSTASLTGYDNADALSGRPDREVFIYDAVTGRTVCVSCDPTGARPVGSSSVPGWEIWSASNKRKPVYQPRFMFGDGRVLFDSADALVPGDTDGVEDVYEWEPADVGSCTSEASAYVPNEDGCLSLISGGTGSGPSTFMDASESGNDVFFETRDRLVPKDIDDSVDMYDARVCTSESPCVPEAATPPACESSDGCRAAPAAQPGMFGSPPSATFSGTGNVMSPTPVLTAPSKLATRAEELGVALKRCKKDRAKGKRAKCEKQARSKYGPPKAKRAGHRGRIKS